jgi:hypothetical protein
VNLLAEASTAEHEAVDAQEARQVGARVHSKVL